MEACGGGRASPFQPCVVARRSPSSDGVRVARFGKFILLVVLAFGLSLGGRASAMDQVTLRRAGKETHIQGRILVTAQDGGILLEAPNGVLWTVLPDELVSKTSDATPFRPLSADELSKELSAELPEGFRVHTTAHYLILYNTSPAYAQWCGALFERLYLTFMNYWSRKGFDLSAPDAPLVAVVFADRQSYAAYARPDLGDAVSSVIGYFNLQTNRMVMYDLTGTEALGAPRGRLGSTAQINRMLSQPGAEILVATILHEAIHQIAFNCGLHTRYSDCPLWFSEGIATYFETPDLSSSRTWRNIGGINASRLRRLQSYLPRRPADSLRTLITDDNRFRNTSQALDAYAEAWALTYFLFHQHPRQYVDYLKTLSKKKPLVMDTPQQRLREFQAAFGDNLDALDAEFLRYVTRLR